MNLIQLLLPLYDNSGEPIDRRTHAAIREELIDAFGGVTAYMHAPAQGAWKDPDGGVEREEIVVFEVMADRLERAWWKSYRRKLETCFGQQEVVVRASEIECL